MREMKNTDTSKLTNEEKRLLDSIVEKEAELIESAEFFKELNQNNFSIVQTFNKKLNDLKTELDRLTNAFLKSTAVGTSYQFKEKISMKIN